MLQWLVYDGQSFHFYDSRQSALYAAHSIAENGKNVILFPAPVAIITPEIAKSDTKMEALIDALDGEEPDTPTDSPDNPPVTPA